MSSRKRPHAKVASSDVPLRTGQWTPAEIAFANQVIAHFHAGVLPNCDNGATLRALLAELLHCSPMRISKKFAGTARSGSGPLLAPARWRMPLGPSCIGWRRPSTSPSTGSSGGPSRPGTRFYLDGTSRSAGRRRRHLVGPWRRPCLLEVAEHHLGRRRLRCLD